MGRFGVTQEEIAEVCDALLVAGERPTQQLVRSRLGTGSMATIQRGIDGWWQGLAARINTPDVVSEAHAPDPVVELASTLWTKALEAAQAELEASAAAERAALAASRLEADARVVSAEQRAALAESGAAEALAALEAAQARLDDRQQLIAQQSGQIFDLIAARDAQTARATALEAEVAASRVQFLQVKADADAARDDQAAHLRAFEDRANREIDRARVEARDRLRDLQALEKATGQRIRWLEAELGAVRGELTGTLRELAAEQARRQTLEAQMSELHARLAVVLPAAGRRVVPAAPKPRRKKSG